MPKLFFFMLALAVGLLQSCQDEASPINDPTAKADFLVQSEDTRLFTRPDIRSSERAVLSRGELLFFQDSIPPVVHRGLSRVPQAWLQVMNQDSLSGWVLFDPAGIMQANGQSVSELTQFHYLLRAVLGAALYAQYQQQAGLSVGIQQKQDWFRAFLLYDRFRHDLRKAIAMRWPELSKYPGWVAMLQQQLPALYLQLGEDGQYTFYHDYRYWAKAATGTNSTLDDQLVELYLATFPADSIQYAYTTYQIAENNQLVHSLLGQGKHYQLLAQANNLWQQDSILHDPLWTYKRALLRDIVEDQRTFWEESNRAQAELDSILAQNWSILQLADRVALEARREQLSEPEAHGLKVNYRSGKYD